MATNSTSNQVMANSTFIFHWTEDMTWWHTTVIYMRDTLICLRYDRWGERSLCIQSVCEYMHVFFFVVFICLFVLLNPYGCIMPPKKIKIHFPLFNGWFMYNHCVCMFLSSSACLIVNSIIPFFPLFACLFICHPSGLPYIINTLTHYLWIYSIHFFDLLNIILYFFVIWYFF